MDFTGKKVMVVGMAKSGVASAKLLIEKGANIALYDAKDIGQFEPHAFDMFSGQAEFAFGADPNAVAQNSDILVLSPGVPTKLAFIEDAFKNGKKVIGEIELGFLCSEAGFYRYHRNKRQDDDDRADRRSFQKRGV